jgi:hypothetical protein
MVAGTLLTSVEYYCPPMHNVIVVVDIMSKHHHRDSPRTDASGDRICTNTLQFQRNKVYKVYTLAINIIILKIINYEQ